MTKMKIRTALRNLDKHGQQRAPEVIAEEGRQLENHLKRFRSELVRLEVVASQTKGKTRIQVRLRLQLPSSVIAAQEEGFEIEPTLRKAFADLRHRVDRHVARLKHESEFKRPARRRRIGAPLPPARDAAEAGRRQLFFGLIEDHLDTVYDAVRRELTYFECSGSVPQGYLSVRDLVDATILKGLERFERRPMRFSVGDWLTQLAFETIGEEARAARRVVPENAASLDAAPEQPAQDPTETDQELFEFHQPDEVLRLEDLVGDGTATDPESALDRHETALCLHRALSALPALWRQVLYRTCIEDEAAADTAALIGIREDEVATIAAAARGFLRARLREAGLAVPIAEDDCVDSEIARAMRLPLPIDERRRVAAALSEGSTGTTA